MGRNNIRVTPGAMEIDEEAPPSGQVGAALMRLATLAHNDAPHADTIISGILALLVESLDVGVTYVARVEGDALHIERAHDRARMGVMDGAVVPLCDTY